MRMAAELCAQILGESTQLGYSVANVETREVSSQIGGAPAVAVTLEVSGRPNPDELTEALTGLDGVFDVTASDSATSYPPISSERVELPRCSGCCDTPRRQTECLMTSGP